jgi:type IX secretion system PorP/SprF family membrane protein
MKKTLVSILLFIGLYATDAHAQDIHYTQMHEVSILRNPALTGIIPGNYKFGVIYKSQWQSISNPFVTGLVTAEGRMDLPNQKDFLSLGLAFYHDRAGSIALNTSGVYPAINFNKLLSSYSQTYLSVGFTGGYLTRSFDPSKVRLDENYVNGVGMHTEDFSKSSINYFDLGAGVSISSKGTSDNLISYFLGVSTYHFTRPKRGFGIAGNDISWTPKWNINAGLSYEYSETGSFILHANYMNQGSHNEFLLGGMLKWSLMTDADDDKAFALYGGLFYRLSDALSPMLKIEFQSVSISTCYDFNMSGLKAASEFRGGLEMSVFINGWFGGRPHAYSQNECPSFP